MSNVGKLIVISGPSGTGKGTILRELLERTGATFSVSVTTRRRRPGEREGEAFYFVDRDTFAEMVRRGEMLEWAEVFGEMYGTPAGPVRKAIQDGKTVILEIDVQGGLQVAKQMPGATFVLILPPSEEELARRLCGRGTEDQESRKRRLEKAAEEIDTAIRSGVYNHRVVNDDLEKAVRKVVRIVNEESGNE